MTGRDALRQAWKGGIAVHVDGEDLVLQADAEPPAEVIELVTFHKAEVIALLEASIVEWLDKNPEPSEPGRCAWCRQGETVNAVVIPFGVLPGSHAWLHPECWRPWHLQRRVRATAAISQEDCTK